MQVDLINDLIKTDYLKTPTIIDAFKKIDRKDFLPIDKKELAQINEPLPIGFGQTISQPLTVAFMFELLQPKRSEKILDIGSGSGWTAALLSEIVGEGGQVLSLELIPELAEFAKDNISKYNFIEKGIAKIYNQDGYKGLPEESPFDKIIVAAAAEKIPENLLKQLRVGGRLVIPIGEKFQSQDMVVIDKINKDRYKEQKYPGFIFVPLVKK